MIKKKDKIKSATQSPKWCQTETAVDALYFGHSGVFTNWLILQGVTLASLLGEPVTQLGQTQGRGDDHQWRVSESNMIDQIKGRCTRERAGNNSNVILSRFPDPQLIW